MKSINRFSPHKTALTASLVFALSSLIFIVPMSLMFSFMPMTDQQGNPVDATFPSIMFLLMPVFYFIFGYIFTEISAWIYNLVSRFIGGIELELLDD